MIIVSQDKDLIVNFSKITSIFINSQNEIVEIHNFEPLGEYKTEERAKEVLQDIISRYEAIELCKYKSADDLGYTLADYTPIYEMPKE